MLDLRMVNYFNITNDTTQDSISAINMIEFSTKIEHVRKQNKVIQLVHKYWQQRFLKHPLEV
jgi:hypothetical protein